MSNVQALVVNGLGINCEKEMALACELAGATVFTAHIKMLLNREINLHNFQLLCFPGGFSYGDELGAAKALANRMTHVANLKEDLFGFVANGGCILGICNGFQLLVKLGLLPGPLEQNSSLVQNDCGHFINDWIDHKVVSQKCIFTQGIDSIHLPIRHGEGKFVIENPQELFSNDQVALQYAEQNPNGSIESIAGICDTTGRVLGMMAHPEAALFATNDPHWQRKKEQASRKGELFPDIGPGLKLFENAVRYLETVNA